MGGGGVPEGDTVWMHAKRLREVLAGRELVLTEFRVPALATTSLAGQTVLDVVPRGKHLLTRFSGGTTLHTHLRMDGTWEIIRPRQPWPTPTHQIRLVLATTEHAAIGMRMPVVELIPTTAEDRVVGHLGPDVLADDFDRDEALRRLAADPEVEIGTALLDQRKIAGLGNMYRIEALFLEGVTPWSRVGDVDLGAIVDRSALLIRRNLGGFSQPTTESSRPSEEHWVFERGGAPCFRCFTTIRRADQGAAPQQRVTYWCPTCQVGPSP
ncbi:MAG: DNA-(apurinic or apyrimidinic site) lyase [Frankiales bacterium]|nr:DNA-(apurinic or apyrimidinic site) lyase [Frankiales bacterium]